MFDEWRHGDKGHMLSVASMSQYTIKLVEQIDSRKLLLKTLEVRILSWKFNFYPRVMMIFDEG